MGVSYFFNSLFLQIQIIIIFRPSGLRPLKLYLMKWRLYDPLIPRVLWMAAEATMEHFSTLFIKLYSLWMTSAHIFPYYVSYDRRFLSSRYLKTETFPIDFQVNKIQEACRAFWDQSEHTFTLLLTIGYIYKIIIPEMDAIIIILRLCAFFSRSRSKFSKIKIKRQATRRQLRGWTYGCWVNQPWKLWQRIS